MPKYQKKIKPNPGFPEYAIGPVIQPNENDVIIGRGKSSHEGNEKFRKLLDSKRTGYDAIEETNRAFPKQFFVARIVDEIRRKDPPGRFLVKKDFGHGELYYDIGDEAARIKVQKVLRRKPLTDEAKQQKKQKKKQQRQATLVNPISQQGTTVAFVSNVPMNPQHYQQQMNPSPFAMFQQHQIQAQQGKMMAGPSVGNQQGMMMAGQGMMVDPLTGALVSGYHTLHL